MSTITSSSSFASSFAMTSFTSVQSAQNDAVSSEVAALIDSSLALMVNQDQKLKVELMRIKQIFRESKQEWQRGDAARAEENRQLRVQLTAAQGRVRELESTHDREIAAFREALKTSNQMRREFEEKFKKKKYQFEYLAQLKRTFDHLPVEWIDGATSTGFESTINLAEVRNVERLLKEDPQYAHFRKLGFYTGSMWDHYPAMGTEWPPMDFNNDAIWLYPASVHTTGSVAEPTFTTPSSNQS